MNEFATNNLYLLFIQNKIDALINKENKLSNARVSL